MQAPLTAAAGRSRSQGHASQNLTLRALTIRRAPLLTGRAPPGRRRSSPPQLLLDAAAAGSTWRGAPSGHGADLDLAAGGARWRGRRGTRPRSRRSGPRRPSGSRPSARRDHVERLGQRAGLVELHQHGVGHALRDPAPSRLAVGGEQVVADDLRPRAEPSRQRRPGGPVVLGQGVLDRDERVVACTTRPAARPCSARRARGPRSAGGSRARVVEVGRGDVDGDALRRPAGSRPARWPPHALQGRLVGRQRRRLAALVADQRRESRPRGASRPAGGRRRRSSPAPRGTLSAPTGIIRKSWMSRLPPAWSPPEMMLTIGNGNGWRRPRPARRCGGRAAAPAARRRRAQAASETASIAFAPSRALFGVPSSAISEASMPRWSRRVAPHERRAELLDDVGDGAPDALAARTGPGRRRAARPPRARPVEAPEGTLAPAERPSSSSRRPRRWAARASRGSRGRGRP